MVKRPKDGQTTAQRESAGGGVVIAVVVVLALLIGGGYVAAYTVAGDKVPRGTTVAGISIGGQSRDQAVTTLENALADKVDRPIDVTVDDTEESVTPDEAGLGVDIAASVQAAGGGRSWSVSRLWNYYTSGDHLPAVITVDQSKLDALVERLDTEAGSPAVDGTVSFAKGRVETTAPRLGKALDAEEARATLTAAYLADEPTADLRLRPQVPDIDAADLQTTLEEFANPAMSAPVRLVFDASEVTLTPRAYGKALSLTAEDGALVPAVDEARLAKVIDRKISGNGAPVDATVELVNGRPKVIPAKKGVSYDHADVAGSFLSLVTKPDGKREMDVKAIVAPADFTTKDAKALKIREKVSSFTTYYPYAEYRNVNIGRAAEIVNGTVLKPGDTFSLNDIVGERTRENGFTEGFIISDGVFKEDLGGGVSQMATTLFNGMFFAGLKDVEHKPHSFYIDRYPVGREATVAWGLIDLRFENDTPYGVLVQANVTPATPSSSGVVTVSMWSTQYWDITSTTGPRYNITQPKTRTLRTKDCYPNSGYGGFDIQVTRHFRKAGESQLDHNEVFTTRYTPSDTVICKSPNG